MNRNQKSVPKNIREDIEGYCRTLADAIKSSKDFYTTERFLFK